jgi:diacylglycerol kinase family enzyme
MSANAFRAMLLVNSAAGTGHEAVAATRLRDHLAAHLPGWAVDLAVTATHEEARAHARAFVGRDSAPAALVVGGGSGTLRAVVEGAIGPDLRGAPPSAERLRIAPLRMGSGNLVAKRVGCVKDAGLPLRGIERAAAGLRAGRAVPCTLLRVDAGQRDGSTRTHLGLAMGGFGAFGRVASDVERWPRAFPRARRAVAGVLGIEAWTNLEYGGCILARGVAAAAAPSTCERIHLTHDGRERQMRLLAGLLFSFRIPEYPFDPGTTFGDGRATLHVIELPASAWRRAGLLLVPPTLVGAAEPLRLEPGRDVRIDLLDRSESVFFLDEDPETFALWLRISVAGVIAVVPGGDVA